jgi:hypothetical protein
LQAAVVVVETVAVAVAQVVFAQQLQQQVVGVHLNPLYLYHLTHLTQ